MEAERSALAPFVGDVDLERLLRLVPAGHTIKGAFVAAPAEIVADEWSRLEPTLLRPPRSGKFVTFSDYPLSDFLRITDAAARRRHADVGTSEGHRRLARATFDIFAATALGRVTLSLVSGPSSLLTKYEEIFNRMLSGPRVGVYVTSPESVEVSYTGYYSTREAIFGVLEGAVMACHRNPVVSVEARGEGRYLARVSWAST